MFAVERRGLASRSYQSSFGHLFTSFNDRWSSFTPLQTSQSQNRWIKLNYFRFVCKEIALNELNLLFFAHYFSRLSPCYHYSLFFNDKRQTCLRDGKTLKVVLCTKFCPACDKQVIANALVQLRVTVTCIFKVFQIALVASRLGQFCETFENTREINP